MLPRWAVIFATSTLATGGCGSDPDPPRGTAAVNATHYDYSFDLATGAATAAITLALESDGNCFDLPVRAAGFNVVTIDDSDAVARVAGGQLTACGEGWPAGTEIVMRASGAVSEATQAPSQVGFSRTTDIEGNAFSYLVSWVGGCDQFGPCQSDPDRFATYTFRVTHPSDQTVLCAGVITVADDSENADGSVTTCDFQSAGGPTYSSFGLMASPSWVEVSLGTWGPAAVTLYDFPTANLAADIDPAVHKDFIDFMEENFGPYPYGTELRLAAGPTYWNGFEHPGNISLSERLNVASSLYTNPLEHTINHELAHMWAGDQTTLASTYDFVWKEAMAEYLTFVFTEERADADAAQQTARAWKQFSSAAAFYPVPGESPPLLNYYGDVYGPGPLILFRQIEALYDREAVMGALRTLLGQPRAIGVAEVKAALEAATGADLNDYFNAWVYGEGAPLHPRFTVTTTDAGGGDVEVTVAQLEAASGLFGCAFAVRLRGAGGEEHDVWFDLGVGGAATTTVTASPGFAVDSHVFDPMAHCLASEASSSARRPTPLPAGFNPWVAR